MTISKSIMTRYHNNLIFYSVICLLYFSSAGQAGQLSRNEAQKHLQNHKNFLMDQLSSSVYLTTEYFNPHKFEKSSDSGDKEKALFERLKTDGYVTLTENYLYLGPPGREYRQISYKLSPTEKLKPFIGDKGFISGLYIVKAYELFSEVTGIRKEPMMENVVAAEYLTKIVPTEMAKYFPITESEAKPTMQIAYFVEYDDGWRLFKPIPQKQIAQIDISEFSTPAQVGESQVIKVSENRRGFIEKEIDEIGTLIKKGDYDQADKRLSNLNKQYSDFSKETIDNVHMKLSVEYRVTLDQKLNKTIDKNSFSLEGIVTKKSPQEGSGNFWNFDFKASDGIEYVFACSASDTTRYQADGVNLDQFKGYEKLKNTYQKVTLIIPKSKYDYVMNKCKNRGCDGMCPSVIMMFSSSPTQPQQQISNIDPLEQARLEFTAADKELNTLYRAVMSSLNPDKQTELKKEQIAWIKKKEATSVQEANVVGPKDSPAWTIKNLEFTTRLTKERIGQLQNK